MANCRGCGSALDPTQEEVDRGVGEILEASLKDAIKHGEICPLCGHSKAVPPSRRTAVQFGMLCAALAVLTVLAVAYYNNRDTQLESAARDAAKQIDASGEVQQMLGTPINLHGRIQGQVRKDETGWQEMDLTLAIRGPKADATARVSAGRGTGPWTYTTLEVQVPKLHKRVDVIAGKIVEYDPDAYQQIHTEAAPTPEYITTNAPPPAWDGEFPCVIAAADLSSAPQIGNCPMPVPMSPAAMTPVDRFETDLRSGKFILRQTDLNVNEAGFDLPLTRTYSSAVWITLNPVHAFGVNANHQYDIAPVGTRNPYTRMFIVLPDDDFLYMPRISNGTGYANAVYWHTETSTSFYKATLRWDGNGWLAKLQDGSAIHFPESYLAKNMAQGAPTEMTDSKGNKLELVRDPMRDLKEVLAPGGGAIRFEYDDRARIVGARDSRGNWAKYTYGASGVLTDVIHSDAHARHYTYDGRLLTWVRDENGRVLVHNDYDDGWLVRQDFGNGSEYRYKYEMADNRDYALHATIELPDGTSKTIQTAGFVSEFVKQLH